MKTVRNPNGIPAVYSDGIELCGTQRTLYVAGQVGVVHATVDGLIDWRTAKGELVPKGIGAQTRQLFANLESVLRSADMNFDDVVKMTVFMTDPSDYEEFSRVRSQILGTAKPTSTLVYVKQLVWPELLVEIDAIASAA